MGLQVAIGVLAIVFVPLAMAAIGHVRGVALQMSIARVATVVFVSILIPIGAGIFVHRLAPAFAERVARPLTSISGLGVVACIVVVWISAAPAMWSLIGNGTVIALAAFVLVGLASRSRPWRPRPSESHGAGHCDGFTSPRNRAHFGQGELSCRDTRGPGGALIPARQCSCCDPLSSLDQAPATTARGSGEGVAQCAQLTKEGRKSREYPGG